MAKPSHVGIIIAGGGTGGHLFPGIAVAQAAKRLDPGVRVLFVGTDKPFERDATQRAGFEHKSIAVEGLKRRSLWNKLIALVKLVGAIFTSFGIIWKFSPDIILGVGGYASAPCLLAGFLMGKKLAIQEQNVAPGITNKILGRLVGRIYASFNESGQFFPGSKIRVTGNPVRLSFMDGLSGEKAPESSAAPAFTVLVTGGSQGAHGMNTAVAEALKTEALRLAGISFIHQTGEADLAMMEEAYRGWGGRYVVQAFFHDMDRRYAATDLVVCRAGATTVAELTALGKPAVFVPFPFAADNHQEKNARALEASGAARVIIQKDLSRKVFADTVIELSENPSALREMAEASKRLGRPRAAMDIAADMAAWISGPEKPL